LAEAVALVMASGTSRLAMTEANAALAVADHDQSRKAEALAALHGLRDAVDVNELFDQLFALFFVGLATTVVATTAAFATLATTLTAATATATTFALTTLGGGSCDGFAFRLVSSAMIRTPARLRGQHQPAP
jgi:hypothetical protein